MKKQNDDQAERMAKIISDVVDKVKDLLIEASKKGEDDFEKFSILALAVTNLMADHLAATAKQPDWQVSELAMGMVQGIMAPQLEAVSKRIANRK